MGLNWRHLIGRKPVVRHGLLLLSCCDQRTLQEVRKRIDQYTSGRAKVKEYLYEHDGLLICFSATRSEQLGLLDYFFDSSAGRECLCFEGSPFCYRSVELGRYDTPLFKDRCIFSYWGKENKKTK